jgi:hypothetical protein
MARYARISDGVVAEIIGLADGLEPAAAFHSDVASTMHPCGAEVGEGWTFDGSSFSAPVQAPPDKATLKTYAASKRWQIETGGITVAGAAIQTDRASQAMITGAFAYAQANPSASIAYKAAAGFVMLAAAEVEAIANAVGAHVQASFAAEAAIVAAIEAGAITSFAAIDGADWPA